MRRIVFAALMFAFAGGIAAAQSLPSVFMHYTSKGGDSANWAAFTLEGKLLDSLGREYPCIDLADAQGIQGIIDFERMRDLLGADPSQEQLAQVGGAIGARYVVTVKAIQMENGAVYLSVSVLDSKTARIVAIRDSPPTDPKNIETSIDSLKNKVLSDMANFLKGKCDEHWTGTITFRYRQKRTKPGQNVIPPTTVELSETRLDDLDVVLAPMSLGSTNPWHPGVRVTRHYEYHFFEKGETPVQERCRPRAANSYLRPTKTSYSRKKDESGDANHTAALYVDVRSDGTFVITMNKALNVTTKWTREDIDQRTGGCEDPPPTVATSAGGNEIPPRFLGAYGDLRGTWDPKDPDVLKGTLTEGTEEQGLTTIKWDLKRVRPKTRLEKNRN